MVNGDEDDGDWVNWCPECGDPREACLCGADAWEGQLEDEE